MYGFAHEHLLAQPLWFESGQLRLHRDSILREPPRGRDDALALGYELQRVASADAVPCSGDDRNLAVEHAHGCSRLRVCS